MGNTDDELDKILAKLHWQGRQTYKASITPPNRVEVIEFEVKHTGEAKQAINKHALETAMRLIGEDVGIESFGDPQAITDIAVMEDYAYTKGQDLLRQELRKAFKEEYK